MSSDFGRSVRFFRTFSSRAFSARASPSRWARSNVSLVWMPRMDDYAATDEDGGGKQDGGQVHRVAKLRMAVSPSNRTRQPTPALPNPHLIEPLLR